MKSISRFALSLAALGCGPLAADAADYDPPIFVEEAAEYVPVEVGSGWYLRGDVGYSLSTEIGEIDYRTFDGALYDSASFATRDLDEGFTWGGGVGYRFTDYLRADATVDGFRADFSGSTASGDPCSGAFDPTTTCRSEDSSEVSAVSVMANGYVDLGTIVGITPYVGAGAGYSFVSWGDLNSTNYCVGGACPIPAVSSNTNHGGEDGWRFTYALMAGVAYDVTKNIKVDVGYKYRHIDGGRMFRWDAASSAAGASGIQGSSGDFDLHEVRLGLRYELW